MKAKKRVGLKQTFQLVKWDGDVPGCLEIEKPQDDPRCVEIVEWELGQPKTTVYKKAELGD